MEFNEIINNRRAYRSLEKVEITEDLINDLVEHLKLSPSCFNNQPWRYIFVYEPTMLKNMHEALLQGNEWAKNASMIIAVFSHKDYDCKMPGRRYYLFDTGMATAYLLLRATELGLVAHPIAGFSPKKTRKILNIPDKMKVITLIIVGKKSDKISDVLSEDQKKKEKTRPERLPSEEFVFHNSYKESEM
ncbi:MAG: nitroreductase family protein [Spirochaetota bacterium]